MTNARHVLAIVALWAAVGCSSGATPPDTDAALDAWAARDGGPSVPYEPLVCDPSRAGEIAFGIHTTGAHFAFPPYVANGRDFLFVDHACQWWAQSLSPLVVQSGTLDAATLAQINAELLTGPWGAVDGEHVMGCCDDDTIYLARDTFRASEYASAQGASDRLAVLISTARTWEARLAAQGAPVSGGRVRLELQAFTPDASTVTIPWPLSTPLADVLAGATRTAVVFTDADADTLRTTRMGTFAQGGLAASFLVVDALPFSDASGCLRPIGGSTCR
jgi:hypothetical protein